VYAGNSDKAAIAPIPRVEPLETDQKDWVCIDTFRDLPYDALTLLENVLDSSHLPFTHHRSVGNRANAAPVELELLTTSKQGFQGTWAEGPRKGQLGQQDTVFIAPNLMWHDLTSKQFGRTLTVVYATPIRKGQCRLFARFPFKFPSPLPRLIFRLTPRWYSHIGQNAILEDDQIFLHYQERYLEAAGGSEKFAQAFYLPTRADLFVIALRKWVNEFGEPFPKTCLPPALPTEALLDRYHSHTQHCASCRNALKIVQSLRVAAGAIALIGIALGQLLLSFNPHFVGNLATVVMMLIFASIWWSLGQLEHRFYQGRVIPPRNLAEGGRVIIGPKKKH
jgi:phenylpropionate dioxygenase-like ring-hydroxylating dioxygenase large terminal subunit